jgi:hypothetical protein
MQRRPSLDLNRLGSLSLSLRLLAILAILANYAPVGGMPQTGTKTSNIFATSA